MPGALGGTAACDDIPRHACFGVVIGAVGAVGTIEDEAVGSVSMSSSSTSMTGGINTGSNRGERLVVKFTAPCLIAGGGGGGEGLIDFGTLEEGDLVMAATFERQSGLSTRRASVTAAGTDDAGGGGDDIGGLCGNSAEPGLLCTYGLVGAPSEDKSEDDGRIEVPIGAPQFAFEPVRINACIKPSSL